MAELPLQQLTVEQETISNILEHLYSWIAHPRSYMHDPALLKKVNAYAQKAFELLLRELRRNKCEIIYANATEVTSTASRSGPPHVFPRLGYCCAR